MYDDIDEAIGQLKKLGSSLDDSQKNEELTMALFELPRKIPDLPVISTLFGAFNVLGRYY